MISNVSRESPFDEIYQQDIEDIASDDSIPWDELDGRTVLVTGATGLIGGMICKALLCANRMRGIEIGVVALCRSSKKAERFFGELLDDDDDLFLMLADVTAPFECPVHVDYIIHGASITGSKDFVTNPVDTISTALAGTENMLRLAVKQKPEGFLYLSSLEVYGVTDPNREWIDESCGGYIDTMSVRSSYSESKRMAENLCAAYCSQYGVNARVARLAQTFGAGVEYSDGRVFAMLARSVIERKDIVLRTDGSTLRNYCYISDAVRAILIALVRGENGRAYNIASRDTAATIREMAELMCSRYPESGIQLKFDIAENVSALGYNPKVVIRLDPSEIEKLGWRPTYSLAEMFDRTIDAMRLRAPTECTDE